MDTDVAKRNAVAEDRLLKMEFPPIREKSMTALSNNLERAKPRYELVKRIAEQYNVDPNELFLKHVIETRNEPDPENPPISPKGASGPFQVMPEVRAKFEDKSIKDTFEREATPAARHMADVQARNSFGSPDARSVVYNYGEKNFRDWGGQAANRLNDQSTNYVVYSRYLAPILDQKTPEWSGATGRQRAGVQAALKSQATTPIPAPLEEMGFLDYYKRKLTGDLRTPEQYEAERQRFNQVTDQARKAGAAAYRQEK